MVAATYFDGRSSRAQPASLTVDGKQAVLRDSEGTELRREPLSALRVSERVRRAPRLVTFADGAHCEIADHAAFDALLAATGHREGWVVRAQNSWRLATAALLGLLAVLVLSYTLLLPWAAARLARSVPVALEDSIGQAALRSLDEGWVAPSKLPAAEQQRIRDDFAALRLPADPGHRYRILFRQGGRLGANALALPGGTIVVTDELVRLAGTGPGLMGVLAHEAGHVARRHGLQQLIQASAVGAVAAYFLGDFSSVLASAPAALLTLRYSRTHEREADAYAVEVMRANQLRVAALADVLQALEDAHGARSATSSASAATGTTDEGGSDFFSSHPLTRERIAALREAR